MIQQIKTEQFVSNTNYIKQIFVRVGKMHRQALQKGQTQLFEKEGFNDTFCHQLVTESNQNQTHQDQESLQVKIQHLERELKCSQDREEKLKITNYQLSNMLVSSNTSHVKKTGEFIRKVESLINQKLKISLAEKTHVERSVKEIHENFNNQTTKRNKSQMEREKGTRTFSNLDELESYSNYRSTQGDEQNNCNLINKIGKADVKKRMESLKRLEKKMLA